MISTPFDATTIDQLTRLVRTSMSKLRPIKYQTGGDEGLATLIKQVGERPPSDKDQFHRILWEYIQNGRDALIGSGAKDQALSVVVRRNSSPGLLVYDNGPGMDLEELARLPQNVGKSQKAGAANLLGRFATGALVWPHLGDEVAWISRKPEGQAVIFYSNKELFGNIEGRIGHAVDNDLPSGTYVLFPSIREASRTSFTLDRICKFLGVEFIDWLEGYSPQVTVTVNQKTARVKPIHRVGGDEFVNEDLTFEVDGKNYSVSVRLYAHPKRDNSALEVRVPGTVAHSNIGSLGRFKGTPFSSAYLSASLFSENLPITGSRSGLDLGHPATSKFFDELERVYTERAAEQIKMYSSTQDERITSAFYRNLQTAIYRALDDTFGGLGSNQYVEDPDGKLRGELIPGVADAPPNRGRTGSGTCGGGRGTGTGGGRSRRSRNRARRTPDGTVKIREQLSGFTISEVDLGRDNPELAERPAVYLQATNVVQVNSGHHDHARARAEGPGKLFAHIADAVSYALAVHLNSGANATQALDEYWSLRRRVYQHINL